MIDGGPGLLLLAGAAAGLMNALAGGGTLVTFPVLVLLGLPTRVANATSTVALVPGAAASFVGYWPATRSHRGWLRRLAVPSLLGGVAGSLLLLATPEVWFARLAPLLVAFATLLFAIQNRRQLRRAPDGGPEPARAVLGPALAGLAQFGVALYGGYFGAGIGILMLVLLGALGLGDIHAMNGLKNFFGICINLVAAAVFLVYGLVDVSAMVPLLIGSVLGGYLGALAGRRVGPIWARRAVVAIGVVVTLILIAQQI